jgi:hypothetical protein
LLSCLYAVTLAALASAATHRTEWFLETFFSDWGETQLEELLQTARAGMRVFTAIVAVKVFAGIAIAAGLIYIGIFLTGEDADFRWCLDGAAVAAVGLVLGSATSLIYFLIMPSDTIAATGEFLASAALLISTPSEPSFLYSLICRFDLFFLLSAAVLYHMMGKRVRQRCGARRGLVAFVSVVFLLLLALTDWANDEFLHSSLGQLPGAR